MQTTKGTSQKFYKGQRPSASEGRRAVFPSNAPGTMLVIEPALSMPQQAAHLRDQVLSITKADTGRPTALSVNLTFAQQNFA